MIFRWRWHLFFNHQLTDAKMLKRRLARWISSKILAFYFLLAHGWMAFCYVIFFNFVCTRWISRFLNKFSFLVSLWIFLLILRIQFFKNDLGRRFRLVMKFGAVLRHIKGNGNFDLCHPRVWDWLTF